MIARLLALLALLAPLVATADPRCSWAEPGRDKYTGSPYDAVMSYEDIPWPIRFALALKTLDVKQGSDRVKMTREFIFGQHVYIDARDMHFGSVGLKCKKIDRTQWSADAFQMANVFSMGAYHVGVPDICGNVFRIDRAIPTAATPVTHRVPEPPSLWLVGLASVAALFFIRKT